jgi:hypothetical protein
MTEIEQEMKQEKGWGNLKKKFPGEWREESTGLKYWRDRVYVPKGVTREKILKEHHDTTLAGHPGQHRMHENIFRQFWWPTLRKDIRQYIEGCSLCQRMKIRHRPPPTTLQPSEIPTHNWQRISVDMIGPLPKSGEYDAILVIVDYLTKMGHFLPITITATSTTVAQAYIDNVFKLHGMSESMTSD